VNILILILLSFGTTANAKVPGICYYHGTNPGVLEIKAKANCPKVLPPLPAPAPAPQKK